MRSLTIAIMLLLIPFAVMAEFEPVESEGEIAFTVDSRQFFGDRGILLEVYTQLPDGELQFTLAEDGKYQATYVTQLELENDEGEIIFRDSDVHDLRVGDLHSIESGGSERLNAYSVELDPGFYEAVVTVGDPNSKEEGTVRLPLEILEQPELGLSDIEFAYHARAVSPDDYDDENNFRGNESFVKLGYYVTPLPSRRQVNPVKTPLYFYTEVLSPPGEYSFSYQVYDEPGRLIHEETSRFAAEWLTGLIFSIDAAEWEHGKYRIHEEINDGTGLIATSETTFWLGPKADEAETEVIHYTGGMMTDAEFAQVMKEINPIITETELDQFASVSKEGRATLLDIFWEKRDPDKLTPENEYKDEYYRRLLFIKHNFAHGVSDGLGTDQGRIYLTYGAPDEIVDNPTGMSITGDDSMMGEATELEGRIGAGGRGVSSVDSYTEEEGEMVGDFSGELTDLSKASLLWIYYKSGSDSHQMKFLFSDRSSTGFYEIVWSTESGEY